MMIRPITRLPLFKNNLPLGAEDGVFLEVPVVALGEVVAEVRASALGAGQCGEQDGAGHAAHGLGFCEAAASFALRGQLGERVRSGLLSGKAEAQCGVLAQQPGVGPHGGLQAGDDLFQMRLLGGGQRRGNNLHSVRHLQGQAVVEHGLSGARAEDQAFKQRVGGQAVGAVNAGAGGLSGGVKAG